MIKPLVLLANSLDKRGLYKEADSIDRVLSDLKGRHLRSHVVSSGEVLGAIAEKYKVTVEGIIQANDLESADKIGIGQKLIIPDQVGFSEEKPSLQGAEYEVSDDEIVAATLMGEGGSMYSIDLMKRVYTVIVNRSNYSGKSHREVVLSPRQFSYWNKGVDSERVAKEVNKWKLGTLPATQARWEKALEIVRGNLIAPEVGRSAYYLNKDLAGSGFIGPNWKLIYKGDAGDPHSYGLNGPPWDNHKKSV